LRAFVWFEEQTNQHIVSCHNGNFGKRTKAKIDRFLSAVHGGTTSDIPGWLFQSIGGKSVLFFWNGDKNSF